MNDSALVIRRLERDHDRADFSCGVPALDAYLHRQAGQDMRRRVAACFVALAQDSKTIAAYYTLAASSILLADLPDVIAARLPRYPVVPAALLGRLAVGTQWRGRKLRAALLADAFTRVVRADVAAFAIVVDPKDASAQAFYRHHGFAPLLQAGDRMVLPLATVKAAEL